MNPTQLNVLLLATLAATGPLNAQNWELGVFAGQQTKKVEFWSTQIEVKSKAVLAARLGYTAFSLGPITFQGTAALQPRGNSTVTVAGVDGGDRFQYGHASLGAMAGFEAFITLRAGIEYRFEKINGTGSGLQDVANTRPWLRVNVGHTFNTLARKPFVGAEFAAALQRKGVLNQSGEADLLRAYAPDYQVGVYAGIRF